MYQNVLITLDYLEDNHYDAIFIGAGGAGLMLLHALHIKGWMTNRKVLVIEPDAKNTNDRTWCFWSDGTDTLWQQHQSLISHSWENVFNGIDCIESLSPYRYSQIRSADFYAAMKHLVDPQVTWLSQHTDAVELAEGITKVTVLGKTYAAPLVFDSRPLSTQEFEDRTTVYDTLWQSFYGFRVQTTEPFTKNTCTLMDFEVAQDAATQFVYTLPTGSHNGLIELTRFGKDIIKAENAETILKEYIGSRYGHFSIIETEVGRIPMTLALNPKEQFHPTYSSLIPLGIRAGVVKSTTGYAFKNMAEHANCIAEAVIANAPIPTPYHPSRFIFYDKLLLRVLSNRPELGKPIFQKLFHKKNTASILRFLDEKTTPRQDINIILSLPYFPFINALIAISFQSLVLKATNLFKSSTALSFRIAILTVILSILYTYQPNILNIISPWLLLLGLIFPGIPHGAIDHWVALDGKMNGKRVFNFTVKYIAVMLVVGLLWWIIPALGFSLFIAYSAWHFGETDLRDWDAYSPFRSVMWGLGVLGTILFGHYTSLSPYMTWYQLDAYYIAIDSYQSLLLYISIMAMGISGLMIPKKTFGSWLATFLVVIIGLNLPLLLAFALYFVGCHSFRGWYHLRKGLRSNTASLIRKATPFSLGAWVLGLVVFLLANCLNLNLSNSWPLIFAFIAAISAPHVWMMHVMYGKDSR